MKKFQGNFWIILSKKALHYIINLFSFSNVEMNSSEYIRKHEEIQYIYSFLDHLLLLTISLSFLSMNCKWTEKETKETVYSTVASK